MFICAALNLKQVTRPQDSHTLDLNLSVPVIWLLAVIRYYADQFALSCLLQMPSHDKGKMHSHMIMILPRDVMKKVLDCAKYYCNNCFQRSW